MINLPEPVKKFIANFSELPSIGPRQAARLAFYLLNRGQNEIKSSASALYDLSKIKVCERCFFIHQNKDSLCNVCRDKNRKQNIIAIVEKESDLISIENTNKFNGRYLIIGQIPKTGIFDDFQKLRLQNLKNFIKKEFGETAEEIILAFNPDRYGDFAATMIAKELKPFAKKITRLGRGLPTGGEVEFADEETLAEALKHRS